MVARSRLALRGDPPILSPLTDALLDQAREQGDPLADATIRAIFDKGSLAAVNALLGELIRNDDLPRNVTEPALIEFLDRTSGLPPWARRDLIARGERMFMQWGLVSFVLLETASLPECYVLDDVAAVLGLTQRLTAHVHRRVLETGQMVLAVMADGGLAPGGGGIRVTQKVRLMHAAIRHLVLSDAAAPAGAPVTFEHVLLGARWDVRRGRPISQETLAAVLTTFSWVIVRGWRSLGILVDDADTAAYIHCWKVVGALLGVREELLPDTGDQARELFEAIKRRRAAATPDGQALTASLIAFAERFVPAPRILFRHMPRLLSYELLDAGTCRLLGLPPLSVLEQLRAGLLRWIARVLARGQRDLVRDHPDGAVVVAWLARVLLTKLMGLSRGGKRRAFEIPDHLAGAWGVAARRSDG